MAEQPTVLRETKIGQKGYIKEDVMQYLDELNSKIVGLEEELANAQGSVPADPQEIVKYRNQVDTLQEKLNASNNALRAARTELDAAKKQHEQDMATINQLKAGKVGAAPASSGQPQVNPAELNAAKNEIERLKGLLKANEEKLTAAQKNVSAPVNNSANDAELAKAKSEIAKINGDLTAKVKEITDKNEKISQLSKEVEEKTAVIAKKDNEISKLNAEITELKENAESGSVIPPSFDMGALFTEAQKTASRITIEAKNAADKMTKDASEKAEKIVNDANDEAAKTIDNANTTAEACIKEANAQAKLTVMEANVHADKINEMSATVRDLLRNEIESINSKFNDISSTINRLTGQASDRMNEAQLIIGEARKAIDENADSDVKKAEAPAASFEAKKASSTSVKKNENNDNASAQQNSQQQSKSHVHENKPSKKAANFNFDMSELLKAAEEEASKNPEA